MHLPKVVSIGTAFPKKSYTQDQVWNVLGYKNPRFKRVFTEAEIDRRGFWVNLDDIKELSWQELTDIYEEGATELSVSSSRSCLNGFNPHDIGCVVFVSCTGYNCPSIAHRLIDRLGLSRNTYFTNILGMGCEGGFPGLKRACDYCVASGKSALVVATELSSCTFYPEGEIPDPENHFEVLRANAIFADASVSALVGYDKDWRHPEVVDSETYCNPDYLGDLGYVWRDGRLRVLLSRKVPDLAPEVVRKALTELMHRRNLGLRDVTWWVVHAAGSKVLDNIRDEVGLKEEDMRLSREILREHGNCSSTTIGLIGKRLMKEDIKPFERVMVLSVGPGMVGGATLLQFGGG